MERLDYVVIFTKNMDLMTEFYHNVLGLNGFAVTVPMGATDLCIRCTRVLRLVQADPHEPWSPTSLSFHCATPIHEFWAVLDDQKISHTVERIPSTRMLRVVIEDPDTNDVCVTFPDGTT